MGFFKKKKSNPKITISWSDGTSSEIIPDDKQTVEEPLDRLTPEGDLPWGWFSHNQKFIEPIRKEYSYFLHQWIQSKDQSPKEQYSSLKSFVRYMQDVEKLCKSKGECFELWFNETLTGKGYLDKRMQELSYLETHLAEMQKEYEKKTLLLTDLKPRVIQLLNDNDGILQSEFKKMFDASIQNEVSDILYHLQNEGKIIRTKSGRSYILHITDTVGSG